VSRWCNPVRCIWCDCVMLCTPQGREIIWASVYFPLTISFIEILLLINWLTWMEHQKETIHFWINLMFHFQIFATKKNIGWDLSCLSQVLQFPCCQAFHVLCYYYTCFEYRCRSLWKIFTSSQVVLCKQQFLLEYETNVHVV